MTEEARTECALCGGTMQPERVLFAVELGTGVLVVRNVPALVCSRCGEQWFSDETTQKLEQLADDARRRGAEVEVITLPDAA
ncbi:MAG: type II toxin-antitoxin system MqsA family antitoxin [Armatimonadia bacterium]